MALVQTEIESGSEITRSSLWLLVTGARKCARGLHLRINTPGRRMDQVDVAYKLSYPGLRGDM